MADDVYLNPDAETEQGLDPELEAVFRARQAVSSMSPIAVSRSKKEDWDAPLDLRVLRPRAVDLRALWRLTRQPEPPGIKATLGPRRPILINHLVTPFPRDGNSPASVWGLGYEFVPNEIDAQTVSVVPDNQVVSIAKVGQAVDLGLEFGGKVGIPDEFLSQPDIGPSVSLSGASLRASTNQRFQFAVNLDITLRKVVGAGVGTGGALWKLFRQDEPLDQPHPLLQTVLVPEYATSMRCTIKTWAKQAGFLGTRLGAKFWTYKEQSFEISLTGY